MSVSSSRSSSPSPSTFTFSTAAHSPTSSRTSSLMSTKSDPPAPAAYPTATLPVESISWDFAAEIFFSVLGHTLYLNGQIPFPLHSLDRLKLDLKSKAGKRRADLVSSMDSLSTQLPSTFQALSYSLASSIISTSATTAAYLAIITGPTPTTSKARFFLRIQGLRLIQDPSHTGEHQADLDTQQSSEVEDPDISFQSFTSGMFSALSSIDDDPISQPPSPSTSCPLVFEEEEDIPHHLRLLNLTLSTGISFNRPSLPLTNTHILLLAPRCFRHPSWLPKQNLNEKKIPARTFFNDGVVGKNDEGVTVDAGLREVPDAQETAGNGDDMIWWIWSGSGPLKGFDVL